VTQVAEVAVNNAFKIPGLCLACVANGSESKTVPIRMTSKNEETIILAGFAFSHLAKGLDVLDFFTTAIS
jgi:hypothetical protein